MFVYRAVADLKPYERNARTHSPEQIDQIAASIEAFGWTNPILVDDAGGIIAGHGRLTAAIKLGLAHVPTICVSGLSPEQRRALVLADNKLALNAGWDEHLLAAELTDLSGIGFDIALIGFTADELSQMVDGVGNELPGGSSGSGAGSLASQFMIPPFSVLQRARGMVAGPQARLAGAGH